jgi:hypothetical protein
VVFIPVITCSAPQYVIVPEHLLMFSRCNSSPLVLHSCDSSCYTCGLATFIHRESPIRLNSHIGGLPADESSAA